MADLPFPILQGIAALRRTVGAAALAAQLLIVPQTARGTERRGRGLAALTEKERLLVVILIGAELFHHGHDLLDVPEPGRGSEKATDEGFDLRRSGSTERRSL